MLYVMQKNQKGAMILLHCECGCSEARRQYECEQEARRPRSSVHLELGFKTAEGLRTLHLDFYFINRFCSFFQSIARQKLPLALNQRVNQLLNSLRTLQNGLSPLDLVDLDMVQVCARFFLVDLVQNLGLKPGSVSHLPCMGLTFSTRCGENRREEGNG